MKDWIVYIIRADDKTLYTGITNDMDKRWEKHLSGQGAKYFRGRKPQKIVFQEDKHTRSSASKREAEIKRLTKVEKENLIAQ